MASKQQYSDEYLKKIVFDKFKELGKVPSRRKVKHGNIIASRFGEGSYTQALINLGLKTNIIDTSKKQNEELLKEKILNSNCIDIYKLVLNNELNRFPQRFWQDISEQELRELLIYFFEKKLKWTITDIKENINNTIFAKYKLATMFSHIFNGSPFAVINFTYPNKIKEWELTCCPMNYWTFENCINVTEYLIEKDNWTDEDLKTRPISDLLNKYNVITIYNKFNGSPYALINAVYPNKFKPWELLYTPKNYWNLDTGKEAVKWLLEEKLKWTDNTILKNYSYQLFKDYKLVAMLNLVFDCSPFKAISETYPGRFKEEDFNNAPMNYWNKEKAIESIKAFLDTLSDEELKTVVTVKFLKENGLSYPLERFFYNRTTLLLSTLYPKKFS